MAKIDPSKLELKERTIFISRVAKVVKGGKRFGFNAIMAVGDGKGHVGIGMGKANQVPEVIRKGIEHAKKDLIEIPLSNGTIPYQITSSYSATTVILRPANPGTGVIAGNAIRAIMELVGVKNILTKVIGSTNPHNVTKATMEALKKLNYIEIINSKRNPKAETAA